MKKVKTSTLLIFASIALTAFVVRPSLWTMLVLLVNAGVLFALREVASTER